MGGKTRLRSHVSSALFSIYTVSRGECCCRFVKDRNAAVYFGGSLGKLVMIFMISFIGYDLHALITQPIRTVIAVLVITVLWYVGKRWSGICM